MTLDKLKSPYELYHASGLNLEREFTAHAYYEILFILNGELDISIPGGIYHSTGSVLVMIPPGAVHCNVLTSGSASYNRYIFFFTEEFCEGIPDISVLLNPFGNGMAIYELDARQQKDLLDLFEKLYRNNTSLHARIWLQVLLFEIGQFGTAVSPMEPDRRNYIRVVAEYISDHYREKLVAEELARRFGVSRTKLLTDFKQNMPFSLGNYIMRERITHAKRYLKEGRSITETAELCGFSSDTHLRYCFHTIMGMTPSEYRKNGERIKE